MNYNWFKIFNLDEFNALELISRTISVDLQGIGVREIFITKGNAVSIVIDGIMLAIGLNNENPYSRDNRSIFLDENSGDVYLGFLVE